MLGVMDADPCLRPFGLCALDIEKVRAATMGRTRVIYDPDRDDPRLGHAHVLLTSCDDEQIQAILMEIAHLIRPPDEPLK